MEFGCPLVTMEQSHNLQIVLPRFNLPWNMENVVHTVKGYKRNRKYNVRLATTTNTTSQQRHKILLNA